MSKIPRVPKKTHGNTCDCFCCQIRECVEWLMQATVLHLGISKPQAKQERTAATCKWRPLEPNEPEEVHLFNCGNCGNGERGQCPLALPECSGQNDFAKWVRPLSKPQEPGHLCEILLDAIADGTVWPARDGDMLSIGSMHVDEPNHLISHCPFDGEELK